MKLLCAPLFAASLVVFSATVAAQTYPAKPIRMIVPYPAGGGTDVLGRYVSLKLGERLGQAVVVENRTGAAGAIGTASVVKSAPDGYTLLFNNETLTVAPNVSKSVPYDLLRDLTPVSQVADSVVAIGVNASVPANTLAELIALAKAQPGKLAYASCGTGTMMHLAGEMFKMAAGIEMTHVPYRGCGPAMTDAATGVVTVFVSTLSSVKLDSTGKVRALAVGSSRRSGLDPAVPTVAESGFPGYEALSWMGVFGPAGMPPEIAARLTSELRAVVQSAEVSDRIRKMMYEPRPAPPNEFTAMLRAELARWGQVAKAAKIELD